MIERNDVILLLKELQDKGIDTKQELNALFSSKSIPLDILKKIHNSKPIDIIKFYDKLRKSYNKKKSKLYINILKSDENVIKNPKTIVTTLTALLNQILQFECDDKNLFYKFSRCSEILDVLNIYFKSFDLEPAMKLLSLFKADIIACETIQNRR